ncbi:MFS transporter [Bacillus salipaludis]|uniref:MFS transporter n=1 Tax=Bacillus salipaludis TaxID=2547811 RepID=A0A4R5VJV0_9BACI|nr:MFS transporter [Bacillus salipaludis]MDQ6595481.1 MFS transporter [Bacillus salipaludis]TDK57246.1 MFS transporter [Bacillus salipaludis]
MNKKGGIFYGWWIVVAAFMIMTFIYAPIANLVSLFILPVTKELGFSASQFMLYFTIMALAAMGIGPFAGKLMKKMDVRAYLTLFILISAAAFIGFSFATKLIHFYLFAVLMGAGLSGGAMIPASVLITNWFNEKRGLCLGIALAGSGFGGVILSPLTNWLITAYGWRSAYLVLGILIAVLLIPLAVFVIRLTPADKGLMALGEVKSSIPNKELAGTTQGQALKSISFWALCLAILVGGIVVNTMLINLAPYLAGIGTTAKTAALLLSLGSAMVIVGKLLVGRLFDKLGLITTLFIISAGSLLSFLFLMKANIVLPAILYTIFSGIGSTAVTVTPAFLTGALFGEKEFSAKYGVVSIFISLGAAVTPIVSGAIFNINHSYELVLDVLIALSTVQFVLFLIASKTKPKFSLVTEVLNKEAV